MDIAARDLKGGGGGSLLAFVSDARIAIPMIIFRADAHVLGAQQTLRLRPVRLARVVTLLRGAAVLVQTCGNERNFNPLLYTLTRDENF